MRFQAGIAALTLMASACAAAQVAAHAPAFKPQAARAAANSAAPKLDKPVARVNGAVLTERDLVRQMYEMFPYSRQHSGIPAGVEPQARRGALDMIIFNELAYQEAKRRKMTVSAARLARTEAQFRKRFPSPEVYQQFLQVEALASRQALRDRIRRSLLIEDLLQAEVTRKARVAGTEARTYYDRNPNKFERPETFHIQSISVLPPDGSAGNVKEARKRAEEAFKAAKVATTYQAFGLLAEKISDDDFRVNMGDHKPRRRAELPPEIVKAASAMQPGQVSGLIQLGNAFTIFRLVAHTPAGKVPFAEAKSKLQDDLQKQKTEKFRAELGKTLRAAARIEKL